MELPQDDLESMTEYEKLLLQKQSETEALKRLMHTLQKLDNQGNKVPETNDLNSR